MRNNTEMWELYPATHSDLPHILEIEREAISPPWHESAMENELTRSDSTFIAAVERGAKNAAGFIILRRVSVDEGEILRIAVDSAMRRRGLGDMLLSFALNHAKKQGLKNIYLEVRAGNHAARGLYEKHGFIVHGIRKDYYDAPVEDAAVLVKEM